MRSNIWIAVIVSLIIGGLLGWFLGASANKPSVQNKAVSFSSDMRKLWEDHITWTRLYIVGAVNDNPDTANTAARLLRNQEDIGNAIKPYYGDDAGNKLTAFLKDHIAGAVDIIKAAKTGDETALAAANNKWYANADEIADFLSKANPNWLNNQMREMMKEHLDLTKQEAIDALGKKYDASVLDYDLVHDQILRMADMLSEGIIKQFPDKF